jgi:carbon storage regulator CsrA
MQVISRSENEAIVIDNRIIVTVLEVADDFVRLSIETPNEDPSYREELIRVQLEYA